MAHVDPWIAIPGGSIMAVLFVWVALTPGPEARLDWTVRVLDRVIGRRPTDVLLRFGSALMAVGAAWIVWHSVEELLASP